jgi:glycosyltransferase involved in cell wall biosynthesis
MKLWEYIDKRVLRTFDCVVPVSGFLERELLESGVSADRIVRIDNGIDAPPRSPADGIAIRQELGLSADDALIVQIGRLAKSKRNDLLIEALTHLPNFPRLHIALVGDGEQRAALQQMVHHERLDGRVHFMGYRPDAHRFLSAADILAITSDHEGLPIVLLEAMAAHCPVVSTDVGAIGDVLKNGESAWLVPPNNVESLAASLSEALASPAEAIRRATRARAVFELKHSRTSMGSHYLSLYEQAWNLRYKDAGKH